MLIKYMQSKYMDYVKDGYYNYCDTRRMSQYDATKKIIDILEQWSQSCSIKEDEYSDPRYIRKIRYRDCFIRINEFVSFTFEEYDCRCNDEFYEEDTGWKAEITCWRSADDRFAYYKKPKARFNLSFSEFMSKDITIDGIIWTKNVGERNQAELIILTSQHI